MTVSQTIYSATAKLPTFQRVFATPFRSVAGDVCATAFHFLRVAVADCVTVKVFPLMYMCATLSAPVSLASTL